MNCPRECNAQLLMMDRSGVEVDYCPVCRGVWLDRGELDKLIDRAYTATQAEPPRESPRREPDLRDLMGDPRKDERRRRDWDDDDDDDYKRKRKKSFLGELFDF